MDLLFNPLFWAIITALAAIIIIPVTVRIKERKIMTYEIVSDTTVLSIQEGKDVKGRVKVLLDNKPVKDVHLVILKFWNSGNAPIRREDYDNNNPILIDFGKGSEILEVEVLNTMPSSIEAEVNSSLRVNGNCITIDPILMNHNNLIRLKILLTEFKGTIDMEKTRIAGCKVINLEETVFARLRVYIEPMPKILINR